MSGERYSCKPAGTAFRITKFDREWNPTSSYLVTDKECECPQGHHSTCRHRKVILPAFKAHHHESDGWFFMFDTRQWIKPLNEIEDPYEGTVEASPPPTVVREEAKPPPPSPKSISKPAWRRF